MYRSLASLLIAATFIISGCSQENVLNISNEIKPIAKISITDSESYAGKFDIIQGPADTVNAAASKQNTPLVEAQLYEPLKSAGTIAMWFKTDQLFRSTFEPGSFDQEFMTIKGLVKLGFHSKQDDNNCPAIYMNWDKSIKEAANIVALLPEIPAESWIHIAFTWDSKKGLSNAYLNGTPIKTISDVSTWKIKGSFDDLLIMAGRMPIAEINIYNRYLTAEQIAPLVYPKHKAIMDKYLGAVSLGNITEEYIDSLKGELVYENPLDNEADISDWKLEGPIDIEFKDGWMIMASEMADKGSPIDGHIVNWCDKDMPANFVAEWDFQMRNESGLCISFFCAKGVDGSDIFSPALKKRDGHFIDYIKGDINNYHISYQAEGRPTSHIRKNSGFALASNGPIGVPAGSKDIHKITLIKNGPHIQMAVDGRLIIDFLEDGSLGDVHGSGKIGFRQMKWTKAAYRNFKVYQID